jgi:enoyl-CoA hydratase/carnithine racemase
MALPFRFLFLSPSSDLTMSQKTCNHAGMFIASIAPLQVPIVWITLNHPISSNAMSPQMHEEMLDVLNTLGP